MQSPVLERLVGGAVLLGLLLLLALVVGPREGARMPDEGRSGIPEAEAAPELSENGATAFPDQPGADGELVSLPEWGGLSAVPENETEQVASATQSPPRSLPSRSAVSEAPSASTELRAGSPANDAAGASPTMVAPSTPSGRWAVQVGGFSSRANADRLSEWCREQGFGVRVVAGKDGDRTLYRVRVGPYASREDARSAVAELALLGRQGFVSDWDNSTP